MVHFGEFNVVRLYLLLRGFGWKLEHLIMSFNGFGFSCESVKNSMSEKHKGGVVNYNLILKRKDRNEFQKHFNRTDFFI